MEIQRKVMRQCLGKFSRPGGHRRPLCGGDIYGEVMVM